MRLASKISSSKFAPTVMTTSAAGGNKKYESLDRTSMPSSEGRKYQRNISRSRSKTAGMRTFGHGGTSTSAKMQQERRKVDANAQDRLARLE